MTIRIFHLWLALITFYQHAYSGWVSPAPTMDPTYGGRFQIGIWENKIYLIPYQKTDVIMFDPADETFTKINNNAMATSIGHAYGTHLQFANIMYYLSGSSSDAFGLYTFDLSTQQMTSNSIPIFDATHDVSYSYRCADQNYIYIVGGYYSNGFTLFDVSGNQWYDGPTLNAQRYDGACAVAPNGKLYGIGGWSGGGQTTIETISTNNILSNSWVYLSAQFANHVWGANAVVYG
eukprot:808438_1